MIVNVGVAAKSVSASSLRSIVISTSVFSVGGRLRKCQAMSTVSYSSRAWSKMLGRKLTRIVISSRSKVITASVLTAAILDFPVEGDVGFSGMAPLKSPYPKMGG